MSKILVRIQSPDGTRRIELLNESLKNLYDKVFKEFSIDINSSEWELFLDRDRGKLIPKVGSKMVNSILKHGDMIYLLKSKLDEMEHEDSTAQVSGVFTPHEEDEVDAFLRKFDGKIDRKRDEQLCHHGENSKCINCTPIEPFDLDYLASRDPPIKFMSFHAYIKKLQSGADKGKYVNLENLNCKIKSGCKEHPPWPRGICNKCQPNTVYLNRQSYRHVDNVMFENAQIIDQFLDYWRKSGHQRVGFLYGRYEFHEGVPLGIRATVSAIYEPPQESSASQIKLILPDPNEAKVERIAKKLGLTRVGWIFTDLVTEDSRKGTVKNYRGKKDSHFLSAEECIMAGYFQNIYKNICKFSSDNYFGSKFVTVVVTGDSNNQIHFEGYQVSNQCMALVRDNCIIPTDDAPELAYIKESTNEQFVPDVYYREKDSYNNEVTKIARPLPVEYLIIDFPAAFPKDPSYSFNENSTYIKTKFPIANRIIINEVQDFESLAKYMKQFPGYRFLEAMTNFHLLLFLATNEAIPFENSINDLLDAVKHKNVEAANKWSTNPEWLTVGHFLDMDSSPSIASAAPPTSKKAAYSSYSNNWPCKQCTYVNEADVSVCDMCATPK